MQHLDWLKGKDPLTRATKGFESGLDWLYAKDNSKYLDQFFTFTKKYDKVRKEDFVTTFPEWKDLFEYHAKTQTV